jgi:CRP/FNR family cyclic AMP-dependent transcriptional regulator
MSGPSLAERLHEHPFFKGAAPALIAALVPCTTEHRYEHGHYLFRQGDPATGLYLIREGRVALEVRTPGGRAVVLQTLEAGDVAGWSWLVEPRQWQFDGRASGVVRALHVEAGCLERATADNLAWQVDVYRRILPVVLARLQATRLQILDVYGEA